MALPTTLPLYDRKKPAVESRTFIFGLPSESISDEAIFSTVATLEAEIDQLKDIKTKSTKIASNIHDLEVQVEALITFVDGRK